MLPPFPPGSTKRSHQMGDISHIAHSATQPHQSSGGWPLGLSALSENASPQGLDDFSLSFCSLRSLAVKSPPGESCSPRRIDLAFGGDEVTGAVTFLDVSSLGAGEGVVPSPQPVATRPRAHNMVQASGLQEKPRRLIIRLSVSNSG